MRERPILFSGPMVRALIDGRKTQTRRIVKPQPEQQEGRGPSWGTPGGPRIPNGPRFAGGGRKVSMTDLIGQYCPYGAPGDRLWVRETCSLMTIDPVAGAVSRSLSTEEARQRTRFAADGTEPYGRWTPAIHMPRWASRLTLEVTGVRVERLNDISEADAQAEGVTLQEKSIYMGAAAAAPHRFEFHRLWQQINGDRAPWESNPWVWVVSFKRASQEQASADAP